MPPSDAYVRSFLYLLYTLIKLYYTKALSDPALSLAQALGYGKGQGSLACYSPSGGKELDMTERLNNKNVYV